MRAQTDDHLTKHGEKKPCNHTHTHTDQSRINAKEKKEKTVLSLAMICTTQTRIGNPLRYGCTIRNAFVPYARQKKFLFICFGKNNLGLTDYLFCGYERKTSANSR